MKIFILSDVQDTGGQGIRIRQSLPDWDVRSMAPGTWINYPADLPFRRGAAEKLYQWADVIHVRNDFGLYDRFAAKHGPKPVVIHFHGTKFRGDPNRLLREMKAHNAIGLVSTLDLWLLAPEELEWLPAPYDVDELCRSYPSTAARTQPASHPQSPEPS